MSGWTAGASEWGRSLQGLNIARGRREFSRDNDGSKSPRPKEVKKIDWGEGDTSPRSKQWAGVSVSTGAGGIATARSGMSLGSSVNVGDSSRGYLFRKGYDQRGMLSREVFGMRNTNDLVDELGKDRDIEQDEAVSNFILKMINEEEEKEAKLLRAQEEANKKKLNLFAQEGEPETPLFTNFWDQSSLKLLDLIGTFGAQMGDNKSEKHEVVNFSGQSADHEVVITGNKVKHNMFSGIVKLNNLDADQTVEVQRYISIGESLEQLSIDFGLLRILGGSKKFANMNLMKQYDSKKAGTTNKQFKSIRVSSAREGIRLQKEYVQEEQKKHDHEYATNFFMTFGKHSFSDSFSKNQFFKVKRKSITKAGGMLAAEKDPTTGESKMMPLEDADFQAMNQFPRRLNLKWGVLSDYSRYFINKFVEKYIMNAYLQKIRQTSQNPFDRKIPDQFVKQPEVRPNQNASAREVVQADQFTAKRKRTAEDWMKYKMSKHRPFSVKQTEITEEEILKTTYKGVAGISEPTYSLRASKYYKNKDGDIKRK